MITIYHNPRCSKSREGLEIVEQSGKKYEVIHYLKDPLTYTQLETIIKQLDIAPIALVRKGEAVWKTQYKNTSLTDQQLIQAMADQPKLIERPIVINGSKAIIGRPPSNIKSIL